jgi:hypothetical protein
MATESRNNEFFTGGQSAEEIKRTFIEAPFQASQQPALDSILQLGNLLSTIPRAFVLSQRRELDRVIKTGKEDDPRVQSLKASIGLTEHLGTTAQRGEARTQRALLALADREYLFHGFVSDSEFVPLPGLTVVLLTDEKTHEARPLTATTDDDGYFRIPLGPKSGRTNPFESLTGMFSTFGERSGAQPSASKGEAQAEILKDGRVIYRDTAVVPLGQGSVYREYVIPIESRSFDADSRSRTQDTSRPNT